MVSPPTRGWTSESRRNVHKIGGFPAHAGMDPDRARSMRRAWFPRPRGDGPSARCHRPPSLVSPPTRGWTLSAAHAGISPPTRGWTSATASAPPGSTRQVTMDSSGGFPAHAGMDPHTDQRGFPAHAGMDPSRFTTPSRSTRFPRPRGDGPHDHYARHQRDEVSPPTRFPRPRGDGPRPRGDGPALRQVYDKRLRVSPPTRGWTATSRLNPRCDARFPRPRGDGPSEYRIAGRLRRFPRPRGDGPKMAGMEGEFVVSPPTRGWTQCRGYKVTTANGFPAHAGMDPDSR